MSAKESPDGSEKVMEEHQKQPTDNSLEEITRRLVDTFARRRRALIVVFLATFVGVQAVAFFWPGTFSAQAALLIQRNRLSSQLNTNPQDPPTIMVGSITEEDVNSEIAILKSHDVITATVQSTGLGQAPPPWYLRILFAPLRTYERLYSRYHNLPFASQADRAPESLQRSITAKRLKDSDVLLVEYQTADPRVAEVVLGELIRHYLDRHLMVHQGMEAQPFFTSQSALLEKELTQHEDELHELQRKINAVDMEAERDIQLSIDGGLREESASLTRRIAELGATITEYDRIVEQATVSGGVLAAAAQGDSILDDIKAQILRLELEQIDLKSQYTDDFPLVEENRKKLEATQNALERERRNVREHSPTLAQVDMERAKAEAERAGLIERNVVLDGQVQQSRDRLMELESTATKINRKRRLIRTVEERYMLYLSRGQQARMDAELDHQQVTNVSVVQQPIASLKPVRPKKTIVLLTSVAGGILMSILVCLWLEVRALGLANVLSLITPEETVS